MKLSYEIRGNLLLIQQYPLHLYYQLRKAYTYDKIGYDRKNQKRTKTTEILGTGFDAGGVAITDQEKIPKTIVTFRGFIDRILEFATKHKLEVEGKITDLIDSEVLVPKWDNIPEDFEFRYKQKECLDIIGKSPGGLIIAPPGFGKLLSDDTPTLTPDGWKRHGDLMVGDYVIGRNGQPTKILSVHPQAVQKFYRITFSDGVTVDCGAAHKWRVMDAYKHDKQSGLRKVVTTLTTQELIDSGIVKKDDEHNRWRYYIPMCAPVQFTKRSEPKIDPWLLGVLIGDGGLSNKCVKLSNIELDIINRVKIATKLIKCQVHPSTKHGEWQIVKYPKCNNPRIPNPIYKEIKILGLNVKSCDKFIPEDYKFGSVETRVAILQGLMDTDGTIEMCEKNNGALSFSTSSKQLAEDVQFMVQSLGGTASLGIKTNCGYKDKNGNFVKCLDSYRLYIKCNICLVSSKKHLARIKPKNVSVYRQIRKIEPIEDQSGQCITVEDPEQLYLCNDCVVTHNSEILGAVPLLYPKARILMSSYMAQVYSEIGERIRKYNMPGTKYFIQGGKAKMTQPAIQQARIVVCGNKSLPKVLSYMGDFDIFCADEVHQAAADDTFAVMSTIARPRMFGFTGSPNRSDGAQFRLLGLFGPHLLEVDMKKATEEGMVVPIKTIWCPVKLQFDPIANCHSAYKKHRGIWFNVIRNKLIAGAARSYDENTQVLIMVETIKHAFALKNLLPEYFVVSSETENLDRIRGAFAKGTMKKVISTSVWKQGVDFKQLAVLINATGVKSEIANIQLTGRVSRTGENKAYGIVHDFYDTWNREFQYFADARKKLYDKLGYSQEEIQPTELLANI